MLRTDLQQKVNLESDSLEESAWKLRLLRREFEKDVKNDEIVIALEIAIWSMKNLWCLKNPDRVSPDELKEFSTCFERGCKMCGNH